MTREGGKEWGSLTEKGKAQEVSNDAIHLCSLGAVRRRVGSDHIHCPVPLFSETRVLRIVALCPE